MPARFVAAIESLKEAWQFAIRDRSSGVGYLQVDPGFVLDLSAQSKRKRFWAGIVRREQLCCDLDVGPSVGVFHRVVQQTTDRST